MRLLVTLFDRGILIRMLTIETSRELSTAQRDQIENLRAKEREVLRNHAELVTELKRIPHLPLDLSIDLKALLHEAYQIQDYRSHELHANKELPQWYYEHHRNSFRGQCLVDYTTSGDVGMKDVEGYLFEEPDAQFNSDGQLKFFDTSWGQQMPKSLQTLRQMTPYLNRTRLISTQPEGGIYWHSHHNNVYLNSYLRLAVVILTLETNDRCLHGVRDHRDKDSESHYSHYEAGTAYLFNSWHDHDFWNKGTSNRLTLISYLNFPDEALLKFLEGPVSRYSGPRLVSDLR